jgi:hypothetical protein
VVFALKSCETDLFHLQNLILFAPFLLLTAVRRQCTGSSN